MLLLSDEPQAVGAEGIILIFCEDTKMKNHAAVASRVANTVVRPPLASGHLSRLRFLSTIEGFIGYVNIVFGGASRMPYYEIGVRVRQQRHGVIILMDDL